MQSATAKHLSVRGGCAKFAEVTVALRSPEVTRISEPELFMNGHRISSPTAQDGAFVEAAVAAVRDEEVRLGVALSVIKIESSYVDAHPDAAREAALSAVAMLINPK